MKSEKVVYILGAGFSKDAGGLLMADFFRRRKLGSRRKRLNQAYPYMRKLLRRSIKDGLIKDWNIEEFFNIVSEADLLDLEFKRKPFIRSNWKASKIYEWLVSCIVNELLLSMSEKLGNKNPQPPSVYVDFANKCLKRGVCIVTFNWDHIPEWLLFRKFGSLNYSLDDFRRVDRSLGDISNKKGIKLLKLHGSVNWLACANPDHPIHVYNSWEVQKMNLDYCRKCHYQLFKLIVPPVWHKRGYAQRISELWERAADELCTADRIVIIGYSLPVFDLSAKYLLLLSTYLNRKVEVEIVNGPNFDANRFKQFKEIFKHATQLTNTKMFFREYVYSI
jgi:NAD-dependent SIR2 family protein deacetylase